MKSTGFNVTHHVLIASGLYRPARQTGVTLLEVLLSLTIIASATMGLNQIADRFSDDTQNTVVSSQVRAFGEAAKAYIKDNYAAVQGVATVTAPALIDVPTMVASGHLPAGALTTNAFGQSMCALVLEPVANRLQAMVIAEGGTLIDDLSLGNIASVIGGSGGAVYASNAAVVRGAIGGWAMPVATFDNMVNNVNRRCDGTAGNVRLAAGHPAMALWFENGDTSSAFLARDPIPGRPELNTMNTPIVMASVQVTGGACTTVGAIARDGAGGVVSCQGGLWKASSAGDSKCVATASDLNLLHTDGRCYNSAGNANSPAGADWFFLEVYRHTNPANYYTAQRVVGMTGAAAGKVWQRSQQSASSGIGWAAWVQISDPGVSVSNGQLRANGTGLMGGAVQTAYDIGAGRVAAGDAIYSYGRICSQNSSGDCNGSGGTVISGGSISASSNVNVAGTVTGGAVTSTSNLVNYAGTSYNVSNTWGFIGYDAGWGANATPQSAVGSAYVNDIYIRSIGKWASTIAGGSRISGQYSMCSGCAGSSYIGRHNFCAVSGYGQYHNAYGNVRVAAGPYADNTYDWYLDATTGLNGVSAICTTG